MVVRPRGGADTRVNRLHQVLQVREDVGIGFVAVLGHHLAVNDDIKLAVGPRCELEVGNMLSRPAQRFPCHPGSAQGVASIPTVKDFQFQFFSSGQNVPPLTKRLPESYGGGLEMSIVAIASILLLVLLRLG